MDRRTDTWIFLIGLLFNNKVELQNPNSWQTSEFLKYRINIKYMYNNYTCDNYMYITYTWCYRRCRKRERKKDTWGNGKWKCKLPQVGFDPTTLCWSSRQMLYQLSYMYQGSPAGRVQIKHLIRLYEQANLTLYVYMHVYMYVCVVFSTPNLECQLQKIINLTTMPWGAP